MENINNFDMLIIDYIKKTYKVSRIKHKMRFRRAMILDDGLEYFLKDEPTTKKIKFKLATYISIIFGCKENHAQKLVAMALGI
jgi:hypothetical protein